jgi:hypothetical protein
VQSGNGNNGTPRGSEHPFGSGRRGTNGVRPEGTNIRSTPIDEPVDLMAVQADDELINALRSGMSVSAPGVHGYDAEDHVAAVLAAWKAEVDADPIPELVDIDAAMAAVRAGRPSTARRAGRHLAPVAAAAAFVVLAIGGVSVGSAGSEPGDALWGVSKVLYSERAQSVEAAVRAEDRITSAKQALAEGRPEVAAQQLQAAEVDLSAVRPQEGQAELADVQNFLVAKAEETPPGQPTDPGTPLKTDRARKVPKGAELTESPRPSDPGTVPATPTPDPGSADTTASPDPGSTTGVDATTAPAPSSATGGSSQAQAPPPATVEGGPVTTTTPAPQGLGGAEGSPATSTTASGGGTVPPPGTS